MVEQEGVMEMTEMMKRRTEHEKLTQFAENW